MSRRPGRACASAACALVALWLACSGDRGREPAAPDARDARREAVRAFWAKLRAADDARLARGCGAAVPLYADALRIQARHEDALYYAAQCQRELGRPAEARRLLERLVRVNPASARGHLALGALLASPDLRDPFDLPAAEAHLRRAHGINGEETGPLVRLGEVLLVGGRRAEAGEWLDAALRTNPKSVEAAFLAGFVGWQRGAPLAPLVRRVQHALKQEVPVKGVLNEGDRRDAKRVAAPPLQNPLGRLLFGGPIDALRERSARGAVDERTLTALWREASRLLSEQSARAGASRPAFASARAPQ